MTTFGLDTQYGFVQKRFRDIQLSLQGLLNQVKDPETGESLQVDFDENDPLIQVLNASIESVAEAWELAQAVYGQFDPNLATGTALSGLAQLNGITRKMGTPSTIAIAFTGVAGTIIPAGQQITDINNATTWITQEQVTLDGGGAATGTAASIVNGAYAAAIGTVNKILSPNVSGWNTVDNTAAAIPGLLNETDEALRRRRRNSTMTPAQSVGESIYGALLDLEGVTYCRVYINPTLSVDSNGIAAKTIAPVIVGGDDDEIAKVLFLRTGLGVETAGTTTRTIIDRQGISYSMRWYRPEELAIDVEVRVTPLTSAWGTDSAANMQAAIIAYAAQGALGLGIDQGFEEFGFPPGADIVISQLYTPVNSIPGAKVVSIKIALHGDTLGVLDLSVDWNQIGQFTTANISIVEVT